ncbi:PP2C family protein-serine/threonine phosphatase [Streptomyces sp. NPDC056821]|uniref:PP2C family protein-serine/threonine phosphatase n=1 Tax=unclassified Streptomyces TaxID=2593676 RepID=UPI0036A922FD
MRLQPRFRRPGGPWQASDAVLAIPLGLIVAILIADILTPPNLPLGPLLIVAPTMTAWFAGPLLTGAVGAIAVAAQVGAGVALGILDMAFLAQVLALVAVTVLVTGLCYLRTRHIQELAQVRTVSEVAQRAVLRPLPHKIGPLQVASAYLAAEENALIGGDLYAAVRTPSGTRLIIGDVMGKGLTAIGDAALLLGAFREAAHRRAQLPELMAHLEQSVCVNLAQPAEGEEAGEGFITAAVIDVPDKSPKVQMVTCGHPPPLILHARQVTALPSARPAPPLGLCEMFSPEYFVDTFTLQAADLLLLYTDGVIEARNSHGAFYPLAERVARWPRRSPPELVDRLCVDLLDHVGGRLTDDAAVIAIQRTQDAV